MTGHGLPQWTLADRLRKIRRDQHLTQDEIAQQLSIKAVTWSAWEAGRTRPQDVIGLATRIEQEFGVPAAWTLGVLNPPPAADEANDAPTVVGVRGFRRFDDFLVAVL